MKNFKKLLIWQKGFEIAIQSFQLVKTFPPEAKYGLSTQITKAAISIPSNIAEGSSRSGSKDHNRFMEISLGSTYELETQLLIADAIEYGDKNLIKQMLDSLIEEQKMLVSFKSKINETVRS